MLGVVTLRWMWWSGLPDATLGVGFIAIVIAIRHNHADHAHA